MVSRVLRIWRGNFRENWYWKVLNAIHFHRFAACAALVGSHLLACSANGSLSGSDPM